MAAANSPSVTSMVGNCRWGTGDPRDFLRRSRTCPNAENGEFANENVGFGLDLGVERASCGTSLPARDTRRRPRTRELWRIPGKSRTRDSANKTSLFNLGGRIMAPRHGFEPRFTAPKAAVLPLDDRGIQNQCNVVIAPAAIWVQSVRRTASVTLFLEASLSRCWARASNPLCGALPRVGSTPTGFRQNT
jgi:hypothetical protein